MVDVNGELKPFDKFLNDVQSIEKRYNSNYLRAEYNFAVASAQSASQWEQIAADGDRFDLPSIARRATPRCARPMRRSMASRFLRRRRFGTRSCLPTGGTADARRYRCAVVNIRISTWLRLSLWARRRPPTISADTPLQPGQARQDLSRL